MAAKETGVLVLRVAHSSAGEGEGLEKGIKQGNSNTQDCVNQAGIEPESLGKNPNIVPMT